MKTQRAPLLPIQKRRTRIRTKTGYSESIYQNILHLRLRLFKEEQKKKKINNVNVCLLVIRLIGWYVYTFKHLTYGLFWNVY